MSKAIKFSKKLFEKLRKEYDEKLVSIPEVVVNEELQKQQFGEYKIWFDTNGYLFYNLPTIDFSVSSFEKIAEMARRFEPRMHLTFYEYTNDNEKGIKFVIKEQYVVLLHDRFLIHDMNKILLKQTPPTEELADAFVKFYMDYGDRKKKASDLEKAPLVKI
jgi:hypothetical protein